MNKINITKLTDGSYVRTFLAYNTNPEAESAMYTEMASACINPDVAECRITLMDDNSVIVQQEKWIAEAPTEATEEE